MAFINAVLIIFHVYVLSGRYVIAFGFMVLILSAFVLADLYRATTKQALCKWLVIICTIVLGFCLIKNLAPHKASYNYEQNAVSWIKLNSLANDRVYYDNERLRFYANEPWKGRIDDTAASLLSNIQQAKPSYDYVLTRVKRKQSEKLATILANAQYHVVKEFNADNGNKVVICQNNDFITIIGVKFFYYMILRIS